MQSANTSKGAEVNLDKILVEEVGAFGKFQIYVHVQCLIAIIFMSWATNEFMFTAARINTRCLIPECESAPAEFAAPWISHAIPASADSFDNCHRFGNNSRPLYNNDTCPAELFDHSIVQRCREYVYEQQNTIVYDFGLACDEWRRVVVGSVRTSGIMVGLALAGVVSDVWGRRVALVGNVICMACLGVARYWTTTYAAYVSLMFLESALGCGIFSCTYVLMLEIVGPKHRVIVGAYINSTFSIGQMILVLIVWATPDWRTLLLALYLPQFISIIYFWTMKESVRWQLSKGMFKEAEALLKEIAHTNGKKISQTVLDALRVNTEDEMRIKEERKARPPLIYLVFRYKKILLRCFVTPLWWLTMQLVYYGLSFNALSLSGSLQWNFVAVSAVDLPGYWIAVLLVDRIGRKPVFIGAMWICALSQAAFVFIPDNFYGLSIASYLVGKLAIAGTTTTLNVYTLELYPTECRHRLYAFSATVGRVGSIIAPLTPAIAAATFVKLPFVVFGSMAFLAGLVTFLVPETLGAKLPDTIDEADSIP